MSKILSGWISAKFQMCFFSYVTSTAISSAALFIGKMESAQWVSLQQILIPFILGIFTASHVTQTIMAKNNKQTQNVQAGENQNGTT